MKRRRVVIALGIASLPACAAVLGLDDVTYSPSDAGSFDGSPVTVDAGEDVSDGGCVRNDTPEPVFTSDASQPREVVSNGTRTFWALGPSIYERTPDGGAEILGTTTKAGAITDMAVSPYSLAWVGTTQSYVGTLDLATRSLVEVTGSANGSPGPVSLEPGVSGYFYYTTGTGYVFRCVVPGCTGQVDVSMFDERPRALVVAGADIYSLAIRDAGTVDLWSCPTSACRNGGPTRHASNFNPRSNLAADTRAATAVLYFANGDDLVAFTPGQDAAAPVAPGQDAPSRIVVDRTSVYWITSTTVRRAPLGGGTICDLASTQGPASSIAVDATHVYWTSGATVWRTRR